LYKEVDCGSYSKSLEIDILHRKAVEGSNAWQRDKYAQQAFA